MPKIIEPEWVSIPAGTFLMGSEEGQENELPVHCVWVDNFAITKYPVTNLEYVRFVEATGHRQPGGWKESRFHPPESAGCGCQLVRRCCLLIIV